MGSPPLSARAFLLHHRQPILKPAAKFVELTQFFRRHRDGERAYLQSADGAGFLDADGDREAVDPGDKFLESRIEMVGGGGRDRAIESEQQLRNSARDS